MTRRWSSLETLVQMRRAAGDDFCEIVAALGRVRGYSRREIQAALRIVARRCEACTRCSCGELCSPCEACQAKCCG